MGAIDYHLGLPVIMLTLFALGILLMDFLLPKEQKWVNAILALTGIAFSALAVWINQHWLDQMKAPGTIGMLGTMVFDHFAVYFFYLFLAGTAIAILMSIRYLETENESHGEYYALMLLSVG